MIEQIDHKQLALERLASQFKEAVNLIGYINSFLDQSEELEQVFQDLLYGRSIDTATGQTLDILGSLIGQSRDTIDASAKIFFGFQGVVNAAGYGDANNPGTGGEWRSEGENTIGSRKLTDGELRIFIRARATKNRTRSTINEIASAIQYVFGATEVQITEFPSRYDVAVGKPLTTNELALLSNTNLIPKTLGVEVNYSTYTP